MMKVINLEDLRHGVRVANLSMKLASFAYMTSKEKQKLYLASLFHDIGKAHIDQDILNKAGRLTYLERKHIEKHPGYSNHEILNLGYSDEIGDIILYHHENFDGSGYPKGLSGDKIPIGARILKITDVFDALTMDRPYRAKLPVREAIDIMTKDMNHYDPNLFKLFKNYCEHDLGEYHQLVSL